MIPVAEASARILARIEPLAGEAVATGKAAGRILSETVVAPLTSPPWDNSSMDGYAVRSSDLVSGARLRVVETVAAGSFPSREIREGESVRVMTGAPVPRGADSVIRHEDTDDGREHVTIKDLRDARRNIRKAGEDFRAGDVLFSPGAKLGIPHLGVLASAGIKSVKVHRRPRVAVISSGDELVELDAFDESLAGSKIVSANSVTLTAAIHEGGGEAIDLGIASDNIESMREKLVAAHDADLVVTTAGISVGDHDHVRSAFDSLEGKLDFWKVRMRPGAPLAFGYLSDTPWIGLSGNPVSAIVTFELFVLPVIRRMLGLTDVFPETVSARVSQPVMLAAPLMHFLRAVMTRDTDGSNTIALAGSQSSAVLTALARANALLILPGDNLQVEAGEVHRAIPLGTGRASATLRLT